MLNLSLQPIAPIGFLPDWIGGRAVLSLPDAFFGDLTIGNEVD